MGRRGGGFDTVHAAEISIRPKKVDFFLMSYCMFLYERMFHTFSHQVSGEPRLHAKRFGEGEWWLAPAGKHFSSKLQRRERSDGD